MRLLGMTDNCPTCMLFDALLASRGVGSAGTAVAYSPPVRAIDRQVKKKVKRGATTASRKLSRALKTVNAKARKKNGQLKKGYTQSRIMKEAQRLARK